MVKNNITASLSCTQWVSNVDVYYKDIRRNQRSCRQLLEKYLSHKKLRNYISCNIIILKFKNYLRRCF